MATSWSMTAREIVRDALGLLGIVGPADSVDGDDYALAIRTLNGVMKELPLHGYAWPNLSLANASLSWSSGTPSYVAAPSDYGSDAQLSRTDANGNQKTLKFNTRNEWVSRVTPGATGPYPTDFYEEVNGRFLLWPVPTQDPLLKVSYITKPDDVSDGVTPDLPASWLIGLQWGLAAHLAPHFEKDPSIYFQVWTSKRELMLANGVSDASITFELVD